MKSTKARLLCRPAHQITPPSFHIGEGNGNPLQYSYLDNPADGGVWKAAVHGVTESRTRLSVCLHFHFSLSCIWEGNCNPLQCSCLENPRDGGAWWAAIHGGAQSQTRLKRLSSSSSISRCSSSSSLTVLPLGWDSGLGPLPLTV